ncbi:MAG: dihydrodipicolinate synthase family protein [Candidatus Latescibacteria bacterium]|nr:dihydrodipicolinate synthase family protein [Candidatus Latescibacterota bacterium]
MKEQPKISGVLPVVHMPYRDNDAIDFDVLSREVDHVFDAGADGIVLALASELTRLTNNERFELSEKLPQMANGRGTVTISVGAETTYQAVKFAEAAEKAGADAVMAVPPFIASLSGEKKFDYFKSIHDAITIPLVVQDASGYMGGESMSVELQARMRTELSPRIYYKPEGLPTGPTLSKLQEALNNEGVIFEGSGGFLLIDSYRRGVDGTMSGSDLIKGIVEIWRALEQGNDARAYEVYFPLAAIVLLQSPNLDTYLAIEKYLLVKQGIFKNQKVRKPTSYDLDPGTAAEVDRLFGKLETVLN